VRVSGATKVCVTSVIVVGEKDGTLHLSGRSRDDRVHVGRTLETVVDDIPMASAGGQISIDHMNGIGPSDGDRSRGVHRTPLRRVRREEDRSAHGNRRSGHRMTFDERRWRPRGD